MKVIAVVLISFVGFVLSIQEHELLDEWSKFQVKYGKTYRSPVEARKRLAIFNDNLEQIREHNDLFQRGETSFSKGINKFADWTKDEFMQYLQRGLPNEPTTSLGKVFQKTEGYKLPESVDWREKGAVREVKDQGDCGSCWSFSTTGTVEGQYFIKKNKSVSLSEQNLVDCDEINLACGGGWPSDALKYVEEQGLESEQDYPYIADYQQCKRKQTETYKISGYKQLPGNEAALQEVVSQEGPVSICLYASENFQDYESGILKESHCPQDIFNHAVLVVGYGSEKGQDYYIVKNSWGPDWGESGYIRIARNNNNMCGLASKAVIPTL